MKRFVAGASIVFGLALIALALVFFTGESESGGDYYVNQRDGNNDETVNLVGEDENEEDSSSESRRDIPTAPQIGAYAPNFVLESVDGEDVQLTDYQGQVVLLNFWAVWCPPCREEMPAFQNIHEVYGDQLVVLTINAGDTRADALAFLEENGLTFQTLLDVDDKVDSRYRVNGIPTTFFINEDGIIEHINIGSMDEDQILDYLSDMGFSEDPLQ